MGSRTGIAWTDCTWNPVRGCTRVSEGCRHCYAEGIAARFSTHANQEGDEAAGVFAGFAERTPAGPRWTGRVELVPEKLEEPLHWRKSRRVFVNSMSDLFHEKLSDRDIAAVFGVMAACPHLTFQVLTKRPERMRSWFAAAPWGGGAPYGPADECVISAGVRLGRVSFQVARVEWPLPNVWLGVSVEDQATANRRIPFLLDTPAAVRFVSYEPALGEVDFRTAWRHGGFRKPLLGYDVEASSGTTKVTSGPRLDWLIVGGESGPNARPCHAAWVRSAVEHCSSAGVSVFVKQLGARPLWRQGSQPGYPGDNPLVPMVLRDRAGADPAEWPADLRVREFPEVPRD